MTLQEKRISRFDLVQMPDNEFQGTMFFLKGGHFRFLGIPWRKWVSCYYDAKDMEYVIQYE